MKKQSEHMKELFNHWADQAPADCYGKPWLMNRWEDVGGVEWPPEKVALMLQHIRCGLEPGPTDNLLEAGCGTGWLLKAMQPYVRTAAGVDFSRAMLQRALEKNPGTALVCGELAKLPFRENAFDSILCYFVLLNNLDDHYVRQAFIEIARVLKKGGRALIGQMPDSRYSGDYDKAKADYVEYWRRNFSLGQDYRESRSFPLRLFDRRELASFLNDQKLDFQIRNSFNPFYYPGQSDTVIWRFDVILQKR